MTASSKDMDHGSCCGGANGERRSSASTKACCEPPLTSDRRPGALTSVEAAHVSPDIAAVRAAGFLLLLESDQPVAQDEWARRADVDVSALRDLIERVRARGRVKLDASGRLVGIAGLSLEPTSHELLVHGATKWTWCALDAVGIMGALEADGTVYSTEPGSGRDIAIHFAGGIPDSDALLFIMGGHAEVNVVESWCPSVNFFTTRDVAEAWVANSRLDGDIVSMVEIAERAAGIWRAVAHPTYQTHAEGGRS